MTDLAMLSDVEAYLGLAPGNTDEALLARLITAVSDAASRHCGRDWGSADHVETRDGTGGKRLMLRNTPVTGIGSVLIDGQPIPASPGSPSPGYLASADAVTLIGWRFRRGLANVRVSYTAGFASVPPALAEAAIEWVAAIYREKDRIGRSSETVGPGATTAYLVKDLPPRVATLLDAYRRVVPA